MSKDNRYADDDINWDNISYWRQETMTARNILRKIHKREMKKNLKKVAKLRSMARHPSAPFHPGTNYMGEEDNSPKRVVSTKGIEFFLHQNGKYYDREGKLANGGFASDEFIYRNGERIDMDGAC